MTNEPEPLRVDPGLPSGRGSPHRLSKAILAIPLLAAAGWVTYKGKRIPEDVQLPAAVPGERIVFDSPVGRLSYYRMGPSEAEAADTVPLLLVHSVNAAGSAYEVGPIYNALAASRPVYALDLPGFGFSERRPQIYTPQIMTSAILAMVNRMQAQSGAGSIDALALSLSSEFLARAAVEQPTSFRSLALISPTGFDRRGPRDGPPGTNRGMPAVYKSLTGRSVAARVVQPPDKPRQHPVFLGEDLGIQGHRRRAAGL